jgi:hypothetical protein
MILIIKMLDLVQIVLLVIQQVIGLLLLLIMTVSFSQFIVEIIEENGIHVRIATLQIIIQLLVVSIVMNIVINPKLIEIIEMKTAMLMKVTLAIDVTQMEEIK